MPQPPLETRWCRRTSPAWALLKQRYAFGTNDAGGLLDDLMVTRRGATCSWWSAPAAGHADIATCGRRIGARCR